MCRRNRNFDGRDMAMALSAAMGVCAADQYVELGCESFGADAWDILML